MSYREAYESWLSNPYFDEDTKEELRSIANDEKEIEDRFYMDLEFGTSQVTDCIRQLRSRTKALENVCFDTVRCQT